jgi:NAD-dependent DNA ligase
LFALATARPKHINRETTDDLLEADGIGQSTINDITTFFANPAESLVVDGLLAEIRVKDMAIVEGGAFAGKTIVFTGSLEKMTRDEAKARGAARRQGPEFGIQEDRFPRLRRRRRLQSQEGSRTRRQDFLRRRMA